MSRVLALLLCVATVWCGVVRADSDVPGEHNGVAAGVTSVDWWLQNGANTELIKTTVTADNVHSEDGFGMGYTPLHYCAVYCSTAEAAGHVIKLAGNVSKPDKNGATPLKWAATYNTVSSPMIIAALVAAGADPNDSSDQWGHSALMLAAVHNHKDAAAALIKAGVDVNAKDKEGKTAHDHASTWGNTAIVGLLEKHGATPTPVDPAAVKAAEEAVEAAMKVAQKGQDDAIWWSMNGKTVAEVKGKFTDANVSDVDEYGASHLHWCAVYCEHKEAIDHIVNLGVDVNSKNKAGQTPVMLAALWNKVGGPVVIKSLAAQFAKLDEYDDYGYTALMYAARWGHRANAEALLVLGANPRLVSIGDKMTARTIAMTSGHRNVVTVIDRYIASAGEL